MFLFITLVVLILGLVFLFILAAEFAGIAAEKGYEKQYNKYFWYCVLSPIGSYLLIIALPDRKAAHDSGNGTRKDMAGSLPRLD